MCTVLAKDVITVQAATCGRYLIAATAIIVPVERGDASRAGTSGTGQRRRARTEGGTQHGGDSHAHQRTVLWDHLRKLAEMRMVEVVLVLVRCVRDHSDGVGDVLLRGSDGS